MLKSNDTQQQTSAILSICGEVEMKIEMYFQIIPQAKQSARFFVRGGHVASYQKGKTVNYETTLAFMAKQQLPSGFVLLDGEVHIEKLHFVFPYLKTISKKDKLALLAGYCRLYKTTKPDLPDNLSKALFDALSGIVYTDDARIASMNDVAKYYGDNFG
jgi:Holliday junction resolvase RusA-like endonuclease